MKYVVMRNDKTNEVLKLGRFSGKTDFIDEHYSPAKNDWVPDNTLYSDLFDGLLEEISEREAKQIIATQFSREKQAA
ncbi:MAG: hypothetical protein H0U50_11625 [Pyrinomonadaceae bacterium]|nr:hypothetical protein [Pyrinomonadaceae bacterium]